MIQYQLDECDKEPIHKLSAINSKKYLLTVQKDSCKILQTSENTTRIFNKPVRQILASSLHDICGQRFMQVLQQHLAALCGQKKNASFAHDDYFYILHCDERFFVLEFEQTRIVQSNSAERVLRSMMQRCDLNKSMSEILDTIVSFVREISGFDRVMAYRFDQDYNGTIVSQESHILQEDFLNHKFPASDIPVQARELYIKNRFRIIDDVNDLPAAVVPRTNPATGEVLDMSFCYFRAVSRIHIQYLQNMGAGASMSLSIVVNDRLWGMIVCHHPGPRSIPAGEFGMYDLVSRYISKQIEQKQMMVRYEKNIQNRHRRDLLLQQLEHHKDKKWLPMLQASIKRIKRLVDCDECIVYSNEQYMSYQEVFPYAQMKRLLEYAKERNTPCVVTDQLGARYSEFMEFAKPLGGILAVRVLPSQDTYFLFIKYEQAHTLQWAGKKEDVNGQTPQAELTPRKSFATWQEEVRGKAVPFDQEEIDSLLTLKKQLHEFYEKCKMEYESKMLMHINQKLQSKALTDPLTGLYNQRYFYERGIKTLQTCQKEQLSCAFLLVKIANFVSLQERFDKEVLDLSIVTVARSVKRSCKQTDAISARIGYEEFGLLLFDAAIKQKDLIQNNIKQNVVQSNLHSASNSIDIELEMIDIEYEKDLFYTFSDMLKAADTLMHLKVSTHENG